MIKNVLLYIALTLGVVLYAPGCSSDDLPDEDSKKNEFIYGRWIQTAFLSSSTNTFIGQEDGTYIDFKRNGTFEFFYSGWGAFNETTKGTFTIASEFLVNLKLEDGTDATISISERSGNKAEFQFLYMHTGRYKMEKQ